MLRRNFFQTLLCGSAASARGHAAGAPASRFGTRRMDVMTSREVEFYLKEGGDLVVVAWSHEGQVIHQYAGQFGTNFGGRGWSAGARSKTLAKAGRVIILAAECPEGTDEERQVPGLEIPRREIGAETDADNGSNP